MNVSKLFIGAALAISMLGITGSIQGSANAAADRKICAVESFQPTGKGPLIDPSKKFTVQGNTVYVGVKVKGDNCTRDVTLAAWLTQSESGQPFNQQNLYDFKTRDNLTPGDYVLGIDLPAEPNCFYQIDLIRGSEPRGINGGGAYEEGKMIHGIRGGSKDCYVPETIRVCDLATKQIIVIKEKNFDATKHTRDLTQCDTTTPPVTPPTVNNIQVCELATRSIITIAEDQFDAAKHTRDLSKCAPEQGELRVCEIATKNIIVIKEGEFDETKHSNDLSVCTPETVTETPGKIASTGPGAIISAVGGVAALAGSAQYYWQSRRR